MHQKLKLRPRAGGQTTRPPFRLPLQDFKSAPWDPEEDAQADFVGPSVPIASDMSNGNAQRGCTVA